MIPPEREQPDPAELERVFLQALDQPEGAREAWLVAHCGDRPGLLACVRELLRLDEQNADGLLSGVSAGNFAEQLPTRIGAYNVSGLVAHGGMSAVLDAVHAKTNARAAVKLIRVGLATARQQMRFRFESELLAKLDHPSIARLFDAGQAEAVYPDGSSAVRSFIAMEFVDGLGIAKHCDRYGLGLRQRVRLVRDVARAVQHAHERGVVHRDLKPANILITAPSAEHPIGTPKVVDFGIAKLTSPGRSATVTGVIMGTLNYMSPEQMDGRAAEVGPASDVYALGSVLYELLAGRPPIEAPSTLSPGAAFAMLSAEPSRVNSMRADVPPDLDAVVHKAIDRAIPRRYANAREMADDLERWLDNRPVEARRPSTLDRARLLYRRHPRLSVGVVVASASVLTLGSLATWQAVRAGRAEQTALKRLDQIAAERDRADEQARVAQAVRLFVTRDILALADVQSQADAGITAGPNVTLAQVLDRAAARVGDGRFADQPAIEAAIRSTIGNAYLGIGTPGRAIEHLERAAELNGQVLGPSARPTLDTRAALATAIDNAGMTPRAITLFEPLLGDARSSLGQADSLTLTIANNMALAYIRVNKRADPAELSRAALAEARGALRETDPVTLRLANTLALAEFSAGRSPGEDRLLAAVEINSRAFGRDHPDTLNARANLGMFYGRAGERPKALSILEPVVETARARLGSEHPKTLGFLNDIATVYSGGGEHRRAAAILSEVHAGHLRALGEGHTKTLGALHNLAAVTVQSGDLDEGSRLLCQAYESSIRALGPDAEGTLLDGSNLAETYRRMGRLQDAWSLGSDVVERMGRSLGPSHRYTLSATCMLGNVLIDLKHPEQGEMILRDGLARTLGALGPRHALVKKFRRDLARCLEARGQTQEAQQLRQLIEN